MRDQTWVAVSSIRCRLLPTGKARGRSMIPGRHPGGVNLDGPFASCQRPFHRSSVAPVCLTVPAGESTLLSFLPAWNTPAKRGYTGPRRAGQAACATVHAPSGAFTRATYSERHATDVQEAQ